MAKGDISFSSYNLYNLNLPGLPLYRNSKPWTTTQYNRKIAYARRVMKGLAPDVVGFQELWHGAALTRIFDTRGLRDTYQLLIPPGHAGQGIVCAGAVKKDMLRGDPVWITDFPDKFRLSAEGDDPQTENIAVSLSSFSRPVLNFRVQPREDAPEIEVFVAHLKSKSPTWVTREDWYDPDLHTGHSAAIGAGISTIRRTAEATALRMILTDLMRQTDTPVVVLGDLNDGKLSNTLNILTGQPSYLTGFSTGGSDSALYTAQTLQEYRSTRDVYFTHIYKKERESLDHILVSQEFYDNSKRRIWAFDEMVVLNDHLDMDDHKSDGSPDHGIIRASFRYRPAKKAMA